MARDTYSPPEFIVARDPNGYMGVFAQLKIEGQGSARIGEALDEWIGEQKEVDNGWVVFPDPARFRRHCKIHSRTVEAKAQTKLRWGETNNAFLLLAHSAGRGSSVLGSVLRRFLEGTNSCVRVA